MVAAASHIHPASGGGLATAAAKEYADMTGVAEIREAMVAAVSLIQPSVAFGLATAAVVVHLLIVDVAIRAGVGVAGHTLAPFTDPRRTEGAFSDVGIGRTGGSVSSAVFSQVTFSHRRATRTVRR